MRSIHLLQIEQWWVLGGLIKEHFLHLVVISGKELDCKKMANDWKIAKILNF